MLFSILLGLLSIFLFGCGFAALFDKDARISIKLGVAGCFFACSLAIAFGVRFI